MLAVFAVRAFESWRKSSYGLGHISHRTFTKYVLRIAF